MAGQLSRPWNRDSSGRNNCSGRRYHCSSCIRNYCIYSQYAKSSHIHQPGSSRVSGRDRVFYGASKINATFIGYIISWWIITPILAWLLAYLMGKYLYTHILIWLADHHESDASIRKSLNILLTISGCYVAYSAGANNAANAVGPFVGAGIIGSIPGAIFRRSCYWSWRTAHGGRVLDTVGKEITELCVIRATFVEFTSAFIVHIASIKGIPVSLGEIVAAGIIGIGCANSGMHVVKGDVVKKILIAWLVSPLLAGTLAFGLMNLL